MEYVIFLGKWILLLLGWVAVGIVTILRDPDEVPYPPFQDEGGPYAIWEVMVRGLGVVFLWPYYWIKWSIQGACNWCSDSWAYLKMK